MSVLVRPQRSSRRYQSALFAREAGHFESEHDADMSKRDFCGQTGEAGALDDTAARQAEVFVDHDDPFRRPAKRGRLGDQSILTLRRFAIVFDLSRGGLSKIDVSRAGQLRGTDLVMSVIGCLRLIGGLSGLCDEARQDVQRLGACFGVAEFSARR